MTTKTSRQKPRIPITAPRTIPPGAARAGESF